MSLVAISGELLTQEIAAGAVADPWKIPGFQLNSILSSPFEETVADRDAGIAEHSAAAAASCNRVSELFGGLSGTTKNNGGIHAQLASSAA
jgi:hypothetical protein